jgi:hypothetical protein
LGQSAVDLYQKPPLSTRQSLSQVLAILQFDSHLQLSRMTSRGPVRTRQMLFTAEDVDIDLQMTPEDGDHNLTGQILGSEQANQSPQAFVSLKMRWVSYCRAHRLIRSDSLPSGKSLPVSTISCSIWIARRSPSRV